MARILIAEDDATSALLLERILEQVGHEITRAADGSEALAAAKAMPFDALLTDWMMPRMDGIALIRALRAELSVPPLILMVTSLTSPEARKYALESGADELLTKPYRPGEVVDRLDALIARSEQMNPEPEADIPPDTTRFERPRPELLAVGVAASTGGPGTLREFFRALGSHPRAAFLVVQHGPDWMIEGFSRSLQAETDMMVCTAEDGMELEGGVIYLAPGDRHLLVSARDFRLRLVDNKRINYVRPAADPLFASLAEGFGDQSLGIVLTGLGCDGARGLVAIHGRGGATFAQRPDTAIAPSMPESAIATGAVTVVEPVGALATLAAAAIQRGTHALSPIATI